MNKSAIPGDLLGILRDRQAELEVFRAAVDGLGNMLSLKIAQSVADRSTQNKITLIPILRSGVALLPAFIQQFSGCTVGVVGLARDKSSQKPKWYYENIPHINKDSVIIIIDPIMATGGTMICTIERLMTYGADEKNIIIGGILQAPEGARALRKAYPRVVTGLTH